MLLRPFLPFFRFGLACAVLLSLLDLGASSLRADQDPGHIKGVKWKQKLAPDGEVYGELDMPDGYSNKSAVAAQLANNGVNAVMFRIDDVGRYVSGASGMAAYHAELISTIKMLKDDYGIKSYLWIRLWLDDANDNVRWNHGYTNEFKNGAEEIFQNFDVFLGGLSSADLNYIEGLGVTEHQVKTMSRVKNYAKQFAKIFNGKSGKFADFFKTRTLIFPGCGNGFDFRGVDTSDDFHTIMGDECLNFAFAVKIMKSDKPAVNPASYLDDYDDWSDYVTSGTKTQAERETWFRDQWDIDDLVTYQSGNGRVGNILFWGDTGDALIKVDRLARLALHKVLVKGDGATALQDTKGVFFHMVVSYPALSTGQKDKTILYYDGSLGTNTRTSPESTGMTVYEEWLKWSWSNPNY